MRHRKATTASANSPQGSAWKTPSVRRFSPMPRGMKISTRFRPASILKPVCVSISPKSARQQAAISNPVTPPLATVPSSRITPRCAAPPAKSASMQILTGRPAMSSRVPTPTVGSPQASLAIASVRRWWTARP